jgi:alpha-tubulin suppressor-like RCC1 family protein
MPVKVSGGGVWKAVAAAAWHTCALALDGTAHCWGLRGATLGGGELDPAEEQTATPQRVSGTAIFRDLSAGTFHTCGITMDGRALCWGAGALGSAEGNQSAVPRGVETSARFVSITAGSGHSCGLAPEGIVYCWGSNRYGQLGDGSSAMGWPTPVVVKGW